MSKDITIYVGTLGQGIWRSTDGGDSWLRARQGINGESTVRSLVAHPKDSNVIYAGLHDGVYISEKQG